MLNALSHARSRPIAAGQLRAFEAVARHLNFRAASEEMSLTQSAISRQIQALEEDVGVALFLRHTRAVELTSAGVQLLRAVLPSLERIDSAVRIIRQSAGRKSVAISTWASFASMWLIPRLEAFQREHPDIDIRIDATDTPVDLDTTDVDLALRYAVPGSVPAGAQRLFGEQLTPVISPWLLKTATRLKAATDLAQFALIEAGDEILMPDPSYPCNRHFVSAAEGKAVLISTTAGERFQLTRAKVEAAWGKHTRGVLLASPSNPTGTSIAPDELQRIAEYVASRGGITMIDEI
jgi:DNA-binding transcriptional LysR family regulator